jgi:hypothetical protein
MCVWSEAPAVVCTGGPCTQEEGVQVAPKAKELLSHQEEDVCMAQGPRIALPQLEEWRAGIADCYFADCCFADCYCCADCYFDDDTLPNPKKRIAPRRRCVCGLRPGLSCVLQVARALKKKVCRWQPRLCQEENVHMAQGPRIALPQLEEWRAGIADCYFADCCFANFQGGSSRLFQLFLISPLCCFLLT